MVAVLDGSTVVGDGVQSLSLELDCRPGLAEHFRDGVEVGLLVGQHLVGLVKLGVQGLLTVAGGAAAPPGVALLLLSPIILLLGDLVEVSLVLGLGGLELLLAGRLVHADLLRQRLDLG